MSDAMLDMLGVTDDDAMSRLGRGYNHLVLRVLQIESDSISGSTSKGTCTCIQCILTNRPLLC